MKRIRLPQFRQNVNVSGSIPGGRSFLARAPYNQHFQVNIDLPFGPWNQLLWIPLCHFEPVWNLESTIWSSWNRDKNWNTDVSSILSVETNGKKN